MHMKTSRLTISQMTIQGSPSGKGQGIAAVPDVQCSLPRPFLLHSHNLSLYSSRGLRSRGKALPFWMLVSKAECERLSNLSSLAMIGDR